MYSIPVWRGPAGGLEPEDRVRVDAAITTAETINARIGEATEAAEIATEAAAATDADAQATEAGRQQAVQAAGDAAAARAAAELERLVAEQQRQAAEAAAVAASQSANFYDTIAAGRAAVADGEQFGVRAGGADGLTRPTIYRRDSATTQTAMVTIVNPSEVDAEVSARRSIVRAASVAGYAVVVMDATGHATWLAARDSDGAPPDWVIDHLVDRMEAPLGVAGVVSGLAAEVSARTGIARLGAAPGLAVAVIDPQERLTWIAASAADGGMPGWVAEHVAERVSPYLSLSDASILPTDRALVGGAVVPILPDMTRMAGWGSSTMEYMGAEVAAEMAELGVAYYNGGDAGVRAEHTLAQLGSHPALITIAGGSIPASGPVDVTASNVRASNLLKAFSGTLAGVAGTLSSTATSLVFTRAADGAATAVPPGTPFLPSIGPQYRDAVNVLNIGKNDIGSAGADTMIIEKTAEAFAWMSPLVKRIVVMGHAVNRDTADDSPGRAQIMAVNAAFARAYGALYFDLQGYMTGPQIWIDSGVTPTADDLAAQARGNKPPSLSLDDLHFNAAGDAAVAKALRRFVVALGWYKEPTA